MEIVENGINALRKISWLVSEVSFLVEESWTDAAAAAADDAGGG